MTKTFLVRILAAAGLAALVATAAACDNGGSTSPTAPATTPGITTTLTGTVQVGGTDFQTFTTSASGEIDVTLTAVGPPPTIFVGLGLGTLSADQSTCTLATSSGSTLAVQTQAGSSPQLPPVSAAAGTYCVIVADLGNASVALTYSVTVLHL